MSSLSISECDLEAFQPRQSLWKLVEEFAPENEQREIKEILGEDIVDETADLHKEVYMLLEIWQDYRDENDKKSKEAGAQQKASIIPSSTEKSHIQYWRMMAILELSFNSNLHRLPEPPQMRSNLKKEIQLFVKALRQRSAESGTSIDSLSLSKREKGIVDYAFSEAGIGSRRPPTARSLDNERLSTPCRPASSGSGSRSSSSLSDVLESYQDHINVEDVDQLADRLRNILLEEKDNLLEDIAFLQNSLFEESQFRDHVQEDPEPEPSLQELKELGIKLEKEMTKKGGLPSSFRHTSHSSPPRRPQRRRNIVRSSSSPVVSRPTENSATVSCVSDESRTSSVTSPYHSERDSLSPSPPTSAVTRRPGSVSRFRKMVLESRLGES